MARPNIFKLYGGKLSCMLERDALKTVALLKNSIDCILRIVILNVIGAE